MQLVCCIVVWRDCCSIACTHHYLSFSLCSIALVGGEYAIISRTQLGSSEHGIGIGCRLKEVIADPKLVLRESFMMNMFARFLTDLPPMKAYWNHIFKNDKVRMICRHTGATIVHLQDPGLICTVRYVCT